MRKLLAPLLLIAAMVGVFALFVWSPWSSEDRQRELEWLESYATWLATAREAPFDQATCNRSFEENVGAPPAARLRAVADVAANACASFPDAPNWRAVGWEASAELVDWHQRRAETAEEPEFARVAQEIARTPVRAYCWTTEDWEPLAEEWQLIDRSEFWVSGFADPFAGEIHLSPEVCDPLRLFYGSDYSPILNEESLMLSDALTVLAHEAEHVRVPYASEAEVECYALQRVRGLVRAEGRGKAYARELALLALDVSYPRMPPEYQTRRCRPSGPLDLRPRDPVWP